MARKKVNFQERTVEGESVEFDVFREDWNTYNCHDGSTLRMKLVVTEIIRLEEFNPDTGEPIYVIQSQNVVRADVPDKLKKKKENLA